MQVLQLLSMHLRSDGRLSKVMSQSQNASIKVLPARSGRFYVWLGRLARRRAEAENILFSVILAHGVY